MESLVVINQSGKVVNNLPLNSDQWSVPFSRYNVSLVNRYYLNNQRQGTKKVKSRGEIKGSTRKIYRQKGTGGARHGHRYAPQFVGGGRAFGPTGQENYSLSINKKLKKKVLQSLLGEKIRQQNLIVIDQINFANYKTQEAEELLTNLPTKNNKKELKAQTEKLKQEIKDLKTISKKTAEQEKELAEKEKELTRLKKKTKQKVKTLIILAHQEKKKAELLRSFRNLSYVSLTDSKIFNSQQLLNPHFILFTQSA